MEEIKAAAQRKINKNIIRKGEVFFFSFKSGSAIEKAAKMSPEEIINEIKASNLKERGGVFDSVGSKWESIQKKSSENKYILCNADEGDPGIYKDEVILLEQPHMLFEGMVIAGYAVGADEGIFYLRKEYSYLKDNLESILDSMRKNNFLGKSIISMKNFSFDIKIYMGVGPYISGQESALTGAEEGKREETENMPLFTKQKGFRGLPTVVSNVETFCSAARIIVNGSTWFSALGTTKSKGTRILSISGDCTKPGIYEVEWGISLNQIIEIAEGNNIQAVITGGPSGIFFSNNDFHKTISFEEISTGGLILLIGRGKELLDIVLCFIDFFIKESCGWCVPCRAGTLMVKKKLEKIMHGKGTDKDLKDLKEWAEIFKDSSRCGLGQTASNPVLTTIKNFRNIYEMKLQKGVNFVSEFDMEKAVSEAKKLRQISQKRGS